MLCFNSCIGPSYEKTFLSKYEFEDFSQFNEINIFKRGGDENNQCIAIDVPFFVNGTLRTGCCTVTLDKKTYQVIGTKWPTESYIYADSVKLQQLAQTFMQYNIPRLEVDEQGNVFVYLKDVETLALVRFANEKELQKRSKEGNGGYQQQETDRGARMVDLLHRHTRDDG